MFIGDQNIIPVMPSVLEVIKLEFILKLKIKRNDWLRVRKQPIIAPFFSLSLFSSFRTSRPDLVL